MNFSSVKDHNVVCGLLKLWLRMLPEPLLTFKLYKTFISIADTCQDKMDAVPKLRDAILALPPANRATLHLLLEFLAAVAQNRERNKMDPLNLGLLTLYYLSIILQLLSLLQVFCIPWRAKNMTLTICICLLELWN